MTSRLLALNVVIFLFPLTTWGALPSSRRITVKFDRSAYQLEFGKTYFRYSESSRAYEIKIAKCNRLKIEETEKAFRSLSQKEAHQQPPHRPTKYDVLVTERGKTFSIARGSPFGTWLRKMPAKILYLNAEAQVLCKR